MCQVRPIRSASDGSPDDARRRGHDRPRPVRADDDARLDRRRIAGDRDPRRPVGADAERDAADGRPSPDGRARGLREVEQGRVERGPVEPDRGRAACLGAVRQPERGPARGLDAHRRDRPRDAGDCVVVEPRPAQLPHRGRRREHAACAPVPRRGSFHDQHVVAGPREVRGRPGARGAAADHDNVDPAAAHGCSARSTAGTCRIAGSRIGTAAIATRCPNGARNSPIGWRLAPASSARSSMRV